MTGFGRRLAAVLFATALVASSAVAFAGTAVADGEWYDQEPRDPLPEFDFCFDEETETLYLCEEDNDAEERETTGSGARAEFEVVDVQVNDTHALVNETVTVAVTVENVGEREGKFTGFLVADNENVGRERVSIDEGEQYVFEYVTSFEKAESYELYLSGDHVARIFVYDTAADRDAALAEQ